MNQNTSGSTTGSKRDSRKMGARKIAVISLAVAVAAPVTLTFVSKRLNAAEPVLAVQQPTLSPADALREGVRQYRNGQYEEAVATLQSVNADSLSEADRKALYDTLGRADSAAASRKSARAEFELGQEALKANRPGEAIHHYYNVVNNKFVDEGTKRKAQEQMAVADAQRKGASGDNRQVYTSAVADYKAGNFGSAKQKFEGLQASGYKPAMFQRTPEDYLKDISRRMPPPETGPHRTELAMPGDQSLQPPVAPPTAQPPTPAPTAVAPPPAPAPEVATLPPPPPPVDIAPAPAPPTTPEVATLPPPPIVPAPEVATVPPPPIVPAPEVATAPPPAPVEIAPAPLPPPAPEVATLPPPIVPAPEPLPPVAPAPAPAPVAVAPAPAPAPVYQQPAPAPIVQAPIVQAPLAQSADPRTLYVTGKKQFKDGDYANARKNLMAAADAGYKPRFLEDSPATLLARMDKKEASDAAKAAKQGRTSVAVAPVVAPAPSPTAVAIAPVPPPIDITPAPAPAPAPTAVAVAPAPAPVEIAPAPAPAPAPVEIAPAPAPAPVEIAPAPAPAPAPVEIAPAPAPVAPPPAPAPVEIAPAPVEIAPAPAPAPIAPAPVEVAPAPAPVEVAPAPAPAPPLVPPPAPVVVQAQPMQGVNPNDPAGRARQLVEEARAAEGRNDYATALNLYSDAASLDPNNAAAAAGRQQMLALQGRGAAGGSPLDQLEKNVQARRQMIRYNFDTSIDRTREATRQGDVGAAQVALENARVARASDPLIFTEQETRDMEERIANAQLDLTKRQEGLATSEQTRTAREAKDQIERDRREKARAREATVADLRDQAQRLINETRYQEALGVLDQILAIDPNNDYGKGLRPLVEDKALILQQRRFREDFDRQFTKQLNQTEEKKIPYDDILRYPANWPDISELRDQTTASEQRVGSGDQAAQAQLDKKLPDLNFPAIGFADVIDFLRDVTGANIYVRWSALEAAGIDRNAPVNARLRDVKFSKALETILGDVGGGTVPLGYTVDEGIITISTQEDLTRTVTPDTRVFDIRDLIIQVPDFTNAPTFNLQSQSNTASGGGGGGSSGGSLFGGAGGGAQGQGAQVLQTRQQLIDEIKKLIQDTVAPDSWRDAGGTIGAIQELSGQLIVTQTPENMRKLQDLLEQLRETRAIQVTVEARFLTVQRNYLEDIGFDLDVTLNNRDRDQNSSWSAIPINQSSAIFTANPTTGLPGSIRNVNNADVSGGPGGLGLSSLGLQGTYLDNFTVQFLLRATQAAQSSTLVTAPRLTLFNGQRAYVLVSRQTAYVSDLEAVVAQGAVAFNPTIGLVQSGVLLDVQATVSSDRKYVTLTLRPQLATLLDLLPFTFQSAQGTQATTQPVGGGITIGTNNPSGIIQQPILQITEVRTTVSVPDGGTLLLGGQTLAGEIEREAGVPILSKVPFLKRLFTNRATAKDEQVLLILVKPTIVIQREQEQRQFPTLSSRAQ